MALLPFEKTANFRHFLGKKEGRLMLVFDWCRKTLGLSNPREEALERTAVRNASGMSALPGHGQLFTAPGLHRDLGACLDIIVECELVRVGTDADRLDFVGLLVPDPGVDDVGREDVAAQQELVVGSQGFERGLERARGGGDGVELFGLEVVDVLVERLAGPQLVLDAVENGHQHGREEQVGIGGAVGAAVLDPAASGAGAVDRDADDRRAVAAAVGDLGRRLEAGDQPLVAVGGRIGEGAEGRGVLDQAADGVDAQVATGPRIPGRPGAAGRLSRASGECACPSRCRRRGAWA